MSELIGLCFDTNASPSVRFASPQIGATQAGSSSFGTLYGWGVGWYPSSERGASVIKDPTSSGEEGVNEALRDWKRFRSTTFVCHLRGHRRPRSQEDAQPFVRSYGGRQWIFAHDGDLASDWSKRLTRPDDPAFDPLGTTDSEHAFCLLLSRLHEQRVRCLGDIDPEELRGWLVEINAGGQVNALLTDGEHLAVYRDATGQGQLHWTRRLPPHPSTNLWSPAVELSLDAPEDTNRTALVFSTAPLDSTPWRAAIPGELLLARRGSIVFTSEAERLASTPQTAPAGAVGATGSPAAAPVPPVPVDDQPRTLTIVHETTYAYQAPVERSSHRLLLQPVSDRLQELHGYAFEIEPFAPVVEYEDVFGNAAFAVELADAYTQLAIRSRSTVHVRPCPPLEHRTARRRHSIPLTWMPWQRQMLSAYLLPPELPESQLSELSEFGMSFVERNDFDLVGTLLDLNTAIYRDFEYVSGSTTNATTAFDVFQSRRGVCQDFANLMICIARLLHIPARYRMGYIFTGADYANKIQSEASHAWVEVYVPQVGWHGLDPTNGIQAGANHIRVACGRNYRDATPTSGTIYRGGGTETLTISVRVENLPPTTAAP